MEEVQVSAVNRVFEEKRGNSIIRIIMARSVGRLESFAAYCTILIMLFSVQMLSAYEGKNWHLFGLMMYH